MTNTTSRFTAVLAAIAITLVSMQVITSVPSSAHSVIETPALV